MRTRRWTPSASAATAWRRARPSSATGRTSSSSTSRCPASTGCASPTGCRPGGPVVVFTTAYSQYAPQAFDVAATDYVLKPFSRERLLASLARAKRRVRERRLGQLASEIADGAGEAPEYLKRLSLKQGDRTLVVNEDDVIWVEAQ